MHRIVPLIVVALAVTLAVAFRVWTANKPDTPPPTPPAIVTPIAEPIAEPDPVVLDDSPPPPPANVEPVPVSNVADTISIAGMVLEQESRRPIADATVTVYEAKDGLDGSLSAMQDLRDQLGESGDAVDFGDAFEIARQHGTPVGLWSIREDRRMRVADGETGPEGRFALRVPSIEQTFLECTAPGFATAYVRIKSASDNIHITMQPSGRVRGRVTDAQSGQPIPGASVSISPNESLQLFASRKDSGDSVQERDFTSETAEDGAYELNGVPVGAYRVNVEAQEQGYVFQSRVAPIVNVAHGIDADDTNIQLTAGGFVFGELRGPNGEAVSHVHFDVTPTGGSAPFNMFDVNAARAGSWSEVNDDGTFRLGAFEYGVDYRLTANHHDYAPNTQEIRLTPGRDAGPLSIVFTVGSSVSGVARYESGELAAETHLMIRGERDSVFDWSSGFSQSLETDEAGTFAFEHLPDGAYRISAMDAMNIRGDRGTIVNVVGGRDLTGIEVIVHEDAGEPTQPITGTVVDRSGNPVVGIEVAGLQVGDYALDTTVTDADGRFALELTPTLGNSFTLEAKGAAGYKRLTGVRPGTEVRLKLGPSARVAGIVVNERGDPIAECAVSLQNDAQGFMEMMPFGNNGETTTTGDDGTFEIADMKPGAYIVKAESRTQGTGKSKTIQIDEGKIVDGLRITLEPGARISGVVYDPDRRPMPGAQVGVVAESTGPMPAMASMMPDEFTASTAAATTNDRGEFSIPDVPPGTYTVNASLPGFAKASQPGVTLNSGQDLRGVDLMLTLGGSASGVYTVNGQPVKGVMIQLFGPGGAKMITTDAEGRFDVTGLPAGRYMAMAIDTNAIDPSSSNAMGLSNLNQRTVEIVDGQITDIDFTPPAGVNVSGSVAALGIQENVMVRLRTPDGVSFADLDFSDPISSGMDMIATSGGFGEVQADGTFDIDHVEPGQYVLEIYQQPDPSTMDLSGDFDLESMQAFMPVLVYTQEITVENAPIQVTIGAPVP